MSFQVFNIQGTILQAQLIQNIMDAQQSDLIARDAQRAYELRLEALKAEEQIDQTRHVEHAIVRREEGESRRRPRRRRPGSRFDVIRPEALSLPEAPSADLEAPTQSTNRLEPEGEGQILDITV